MNTRWLHSHRTLMVSLVIAMVAVGVLTALVIRQQEDQANGQVYLEAGGSVGSNPFVPPVAARKAENGVPGNGGSSSGATTSTDNRKVGDQETLISYLGAHPKAATAWVEALNSDPSLNWSGGNRVEVQQIPAYLHELTPRSLDADLRVTDYQFANGAAHAVQSILESGTLVLVDAKGVSRVRCASGNPLVPMIPLRMRPRYKGTPWSGFQPQRVIVTQRGLQCERNDYFDGERCRRIAVCPRGEYRGDGGRCHDRDRPSPLAEGGPSSELKKPAKSGSSGEVTRPAESGPSDEVKKPAKSGPSDEVKKPAKSGPSDEVRRPAAGGEVTRPAESGPSGEVNKPAKDASTGEVKKPDKGDPSTGPQRSDKGGPPDQPGHGDTGKREQSGKSTPCSSGSASNGTCVPDHQLS
jgi:hypothetical protein